MADQDEEIIDTLVKGLLKAPCHFWACEGYEKEIEPMATCKRCAALHRVFDKRPELKEKHT